MKEAKVLGIIFSNMHDEYMGEITHRRTMASVPFGGRYRFIDFTLSNMVNSGITDIGVITKSNYQSLMDHLGSGRDWDLSRKRGGLCILPPFSSINSTGIYSGRLDALAGILGYIRNSAAKYVVMADCDVISNINLQKVLDAHKETGAELTLVYKHELCTLKRGCDASVLKMNDAGRVTDVLMSPEYSGEADIYLDIAVIERELLVQIVSDAASRNQTSFVRDLIQARKDVYKIHGYRFDGYANKIDNMQNYYKANMDLLNRAVLEELFVDDRPIYTKVRDEAPAKYGLSASSANSLMADGCVIEGTVENSILFRGVHVGKGASVRDSIIMQGTTIGDGCNLQYVILDKDVAVRSGRNLMGYSTYPVYVAKGSQV